MDRLRPHAVAALAAITLFIWGNRIWLAWTNDEDTLAEKLAYSVPITAFVIAAIVLGVTMLAGADRTSTWFTRLTQAFAGGTIAYWAIRAPMITFADHDVPFKVVHGVLAVVSIAASVAAWRAVPVAEGRETVAHGDDARTNDGRGAGAGTGTGTGQLQQ